MAVARYVYIEVVTELFVLLRWSYAVRWLILWLLSASEIIGYFLYKVFNVKKFYILLTAYLCFVWVSTDSDSLYNINRSAVIT